MNFETEVYLPKRVIERLVKYMHDGCMLKIALEDFDGRVIRRYIVNDNVIIWSEEAIE